MGKCIAIFLKLDTLPHFGFVADAWRHFVRLAYES